MFFNAIFNKALKLNDQPDSLKYYCNQFSGDMDYIQIQEKVDDAAESYIRPAIGDALFEALIDQWNDELNPPTGNVLLCIRKIQSALAYFTYFESLRTGAIYISEMGPHQVATQNMVPSNQWRTRQGLKAAWEVANRRLNRVLEFLDRNASQSEFILWHDATEFDSRHTLLFPTAQSLEEYLPMGKLSHLVYQRLRPIIRQAEQQYLAPVMSQELLDELRDSLLSAAKANTSLSTTERILLHQCRQALVYWVKRNAIPFLRMSISDRGLVEIDYDIDSNHGQQRPVSEEGARSLWITSQQAAEYFTHELTSFLQLNANDYLTFKNSGIFVEDQADGAFQKSWNNSNTGIGSML